jgi:hypothetical protein
LAATWWTNTATGSMSHSVTRRADGESPWRNEDAGSQADDKRADYRFGRTDMGSVRLRGMRSGEEGEGFGGGGDGAVDVFVRVFG